MRESRALGRGARRSGLSHLLAAALVLLLGAVSATSAAADYYDGLAAYQAENYPEARRHLEPLARMGDSRAQRLIGIMHRDGRGQPRDNLQAYAWLQVAAAGGDAEAASARDALAWQMAPDDLEAAQTLANAWRPGRGMIAADRPESRMLDRAEILDLQWQLALHGYDPGPADGIAGSRTRAAIRAYQADAGLLEDGAPTLALLERLQYGATAVAGKNSIETEALEPQTTTRAADDGYGDSEDFGDETAAADSAIDTEDDADLGDDDADFDGGAGIPQQSNRSDIMYVYTVTVQQELALQGYYNGPIDGVLSSRMQSAIRRYQADNGLGVTGEVSLELVNSLRLITGKDSPEI